MVIRVCRNVLSCKTIFYKSQLMYRAYRLATGRAMATEDGASTNPELSVAELNSCGQDPDIEAEVSSGRKDFKSALVIMPPESVWDQIQDIRRIHDDRFERWLPHINMIYPFWKDEGEVFATSAGQVKSALSVIKPFKVRFSKKSFNFFIHKKYCTLWLRPLVTVEEGAHATSGDSTDFALGFKDKSCTSVTGLETDNDHNWTLGHSSDTTGAVDGCKSDKTLTGGSNLGADAQELSSSDAFESTDSQMPKKSKRLLKDERKAEKKRRQKEGSLKSEDAVNYPPHPKVLEMHTLLQQLYPQLASNDDPDLGFQPHLSLGQFKPTEVEEYKDKFQKQWTDIEFEVSNVYLISRKDFYDPFHVRETVRLGTCE